MNNIIIRQETAADFRTVEEVVRDSFWNVYRPGCAEHFVLHCFRDNADFIPELDLILETDGRIIGQIMYARAAIVTESGEKLPVATFGPVSVLTDYRRQGLGERLISHSLGMASEMGFSAVMITGDLNYYKRFGFVCGKDLGITYADDPDAEYFLALELRSDALSGVRGTYRDPDGYFPDEAVLEEFDKTFPPREKLRLPGQLG